MRQPIADHIEDLREFLRFAVPLRSLTLVADRTPKELQRILPGLALEAARKLGSRGDALLFAGGQQKAITRTADDLVSGIAALALMSGPDGIDVFGLHFCSAAPCPHRTTPQA